MGEFLKAGNRMLLGAAAGLYQAATDIMYVSEQECPVDTGTLRASGRVEEPVSEAGFIQVTLGYGYGEELNPKTGRPAYGYAVPVHERMDVHHDPPTKAKFLEDPVLAYEALYGDTVAAYMVMALETGEIVRVEDVRPNPEVVANVGGHIAGRKRLRELAEASRKVGAIRVRGVGE